ncbi:MAG: linear amide C-N hydrolase [Candidatus Latescibacterota bacterium]|jgi:choloylglycine hydrolase|nr:MAG: linear amide C-N hydrolase [Candidatus Latescibacterota bacterium]
MAMISRSIALFPAIALFLVSMLLPADALPCSTFLIRQGREIVFGKNYDFRVSEGRLMVNKRGVAKFALALGSRNPAKWVSRYGSVSFNQVAREYPNGGMNEAGLVVEIMWLDSTKYPAPDDRAAISELQWIQYQLDNCATVADVLATDGVIRIEPTGKPVHFFVADRDGDAATIEFLDGALVYRRAESLPVPALTNHTYDESLACLSRHEGFGGRERAAGGWESLDRFVTCARIVRDARSVRSKKLVPYAFDALETVSQGDRTVWSIVYDMERRVVRFRTVGRPDIRILKLERCDFSCESPALMLDLETEIEGDVAGRLVRWTTELNRDLIGRTFKRYAEESFMSLSAEAQDYLARYPERFECRADGGR